MSGSSPYRTVCRLMTVASGCVALASAQAIAQTSYPMICSLKPVAVQVGQRSERTVFAIHSLTGASQIYVSGEGVTGEVIKPAEVAGMPPAASPQHAVAFTVAADALPGVREFRIATPRGASTVGQLLVVEDPVIHEAGDNDTPATAVAVTIPSVVCGAFEKNEDVDCFKFHAVAGQTVTMHVLCQRLQDKIHDLQVHADPIITLRDSLGAVLGMSDNEYFADPHLSYQISLDGEYTLEIRDARYQSNGYWEYAIQLTDRPFITGAFPLAFQTGRDHTVEVSGPLLDPVTSATVLARGTAAGSATSRAPQLTRPQIGEHLLQPLNVLWHSLPDYREAASSNETPAEAPLLAVPVMVNGQIDRDSDLDYYAFEARQGEAISVEVFARRGLSRLDSLVRIVNADLGAYVENDDYQSPSLRYGDSRIQNWVVPADGRYFVEIRDLHLRGGSGYGYALSIERSQPYFALTIDTDKTQLTPGTRGAIFARVHRLNGFAGEVQLSLTGLPPGVTAECGRILANGLDGCILLSAAPDAAPAWSNVAVVGTSRVETGPLAGTELSAIATPLQETYNPGGGRVHWPVENHTVHVGEPNDIRDVKVSQTEIRLTPGGTAKIDVEIVRSPTYGGNITLDFPFQHLGQIYGNSLPPGVSIDLAQSKVLLVPGETTGYVTLKAEPNAAAAERQLSALQAHVSINFVMKASYASPPIWVTVAKDPPTTP